jgi:peptidoglycan/xylan/chitin deacetylase (PgdA/CDA1 family)
MYPILKRLKLPATFFICPGLIDEGRWLWNVEARQRLASLHLPVLRELAADFRVPAAVEPCVRWMKTLNLTSRLRVEQHIREASADFVPTADQREECDLATWDELRSLDPSVVTLGSHTMSHPILSQCTAAEIENEVGESRRVIEQRLQRRVELFAYPNGDQNARVRESVARHYRAAVTTVPSWVRPGMNPLLLPRVDAPRGAMRLCWNMHSQDYLPAF